MPKVSPYVYTLNKAQQRALKALYDRFPIYESVIGPERPITYREFRRMAKVSPLMGCVMVPWADMLVGIEPDGHTHS